MYSKHYLGLLITAHFFVGAQAAQSDDSESEEHTFERITVTATRLERPVFDTPSAVSVIDREDVQRFQPLAYADVLEGIPGVAIQGGSRRISEEPSIRGFLDSQIVIRLDGARQNFDLAHRGRFFVDPDLVQRIEVLRGSASALYGSGALGGVISIDTVSAKDLLKEGETLGGRVKVGYQSNGNEFLTSAGLFGQFGKVDAFANLVYRDVSEDLEGGSGDDIIDTQDRVVNGLVNVGIDIAPHHRVEIIADTFDNEGENPTAADNVSSPNTVVDRETQEQNVRLNYRFNNPENSVWDLKATLFNTDIDIREERFVDERLDISDFTSQGLDINNTTRFYTDKASIALTYGIEWFEDEQSGTRNGLNRLQFPDSTRTFTAAYVQAEFNILDTLTVIPGIRFDDFKQDSSAGSRNEDDINARLAINYKATDWLSIWGSFSEAFRAPSLTELFNDGTHFSVPGGLGPDTLVINQFVPTPDLAPEQAETAELGARVSYTNDETGANFESAVTLFSSEIDNFVNQVVTFFDPTIPPQFIPPRGPAVFFGTTESTNVRAEISGVEAEFHYSTETLSLSLTGFTIDGEDRDTDIGLGSIPQDSATLSINKFIPSLDLSIGGRATIASSQRDVPEGSVETDGYQTVDIYASWTPQKFAGFSLTAGVDNLFDQSFSVHPTVIEQPGRSFRVTVSKRFGIR